mgnify:CR=1 FL=1
MIHAFPDLLDGTHDCPRACSHDEPDCGLDAWAAGQPPAIVVRIAKDIKKTLESAIANAENNHDLDVDALIVAEAHVGKALVMKRFSPRGRGRMGKILKPFANLTIVVRQVENKAA